MADLLREDLSIEGGPWSAVDDRLSEGKELSVWWREFLLSEAEGEGGGILRSLLVNLQREDETRHTAETFYVSVIENNI